MVDGYVLVTLGSNLAATFPPIAARLRFLLSTLVPPHCLIILKKINLSLLSKPIWI